MIRINKYARPLIILAMMSFFSVSASAQKFMLIKDGKVIRTYENWGAYRDLEPDGSGTGLTMVYSSTSCNGNYNAKQDVATTDSKSKSATTDSQGEESDKAKNVNTASQRQENAEADEKK